MEGPYISIPVAYVHVINHFTIQRTETSVKLDLPTPVVNVKKSHVLRIVSTAK